LNLLDKAHDAAIIAEWCDSRCPGVRG
jgi:hypothetical protein